MAKPNKELLNLDLGRVDSKPTEGKRFILNLSDTSLHRAIHNTITILSFWTDRSGQIV